MKKIISVPVMLVMFAVMVISLVSCGQAKEYDTVGEYVDSIRTSDPDYEKCMALDGMNVTLAAEGEKMVYTYACDKTDGTQKIAEEFEQMLSEEPGSMNVMFQNIADETGKYVDVDQGCVEIRLIDSGGKTFYSRTYTSHMEE